MGTVESRPEPLVDRLGRGLGRRWGRRWGQFTYVTASQAPLLLDPIWGLTDNGEGSLS